MILQATDPRSQPRTGNTTLAVVILDRNDNAPTISGMNQTIILQRDVELKPFPSSKYPHCTVRILVYGM